MGLAWSQHLLNMLIGDQLGLANSDVFGQGKVSEKSGNFTFYSLWEPCLRVFVTSFKRNNDVTPVTP